MINNVNGFRDVLPQEMAERVNIEGLLRESYRSWGYREVLTPAVEYFDSISSQYSQELKDQLFKLTDRDGKVLAMRPELTSSMARMCSQRMREEELPIRLFSIANVYRDEDTQRGQQKEFRQADIELFGASTPEADAEVIALLINSLLRLGMKGFKVFVGQVEWIRKTLDEARLNDEEKIEFIKALQKRNMLEVKALSEKKNSQVLKVLSKLQGKDIWNNPLIAQQAQTGPLAHLKKVDVLLEGYGLKDWYEIDLTLVRNFNYYTGVVFEGFADGLGFSLCGGGRYDSLMQEFGFAVPAVGFQIGLERLHIAMQEQGLFAAPDKAKWVIGFRNDPLAAYRLAEKMRGQGVGAECLLDSTEPEGGYEIARQRKAYGYIQSDHEAGNIWIKDREGEGKILPANKLLEYLNGKAD